MSINELDDAYNDFITLHDIHIDRIGRMTN
jgi:hypothetical protein